MVRRRQLLHGADTGSVQARGERERNDDAAMERQSEVVERCLWAKSVLHRSS